MSATEARLAAVEARLAAVEARLAGGAPAASNGGGGAVADDAELDGEWGDPTIGKDPKRWLEQGGESYAGCRMSQCPSDYLRAYASLKEWQANQDEAKGKTYTNKKTGQQAPTAPLSRRDAARARGWAQRNAGKAAARAPAASVDTGHGDFGSDDSEIPF